ncbi:MAG: metallophosphoesterase family protein [Mobilitalea sp.]
MKFLHIADVHLGAIPDSNMSWGAEREKEIWSSFQNIITVCNEEKVDLLLIAGDLFHRQPLVRELKEVNYSFSKLETARVAIMAGNHDFMGARSYYQGFEWDEKVHMFLNDAMDIVEFPVLGVEVYGFSYHTRDIIEPLYDTVKPANNDRIHILLAHGGDEKDIPFNRRKLQDSGFDYIALGHIHKPEIISNRIAYSGSLEPLDKNETGERGHILGEINCDEKGETKTSIRFVSSSVRQYKRIVLSVNQDTTNGSLLDQVRETIRVNGVKHIYSFLIQGVRDESIHFDRESVKLLGNVLEVYDQSVPDYDFDQLYRENSDNMIGLFIKRIRENANQDEVAKKALYYGMEALLGAKD